MWHSRLWPVISLLAVLAVPRPAHAQQWDPIPELPEESHLAVGGGVQDQIDREEADTCLSEFESAVDASYYAVVVGVTDRQGRRDPAYNDAVPFVDATYQQWTPSERIDDDRDNIIALGLDNRAVAIHPGNRWVQLGFERVMITRTIDNSAFKRYARNGDYAGAICELAGAVDRKLASLIDDLEQKREQLADQAEKLRERAQTIRQKASKVPEYSKPLARSLEKPLRRARERAVEAKDAADRERVSTAKARIEAARPLVEDAAKRVSRHKTAIERLPELRNRHEELTEQITSRPDSDWELPRRAKSKLAECEKATDSVQGQLEQGASVEPMLTDAEQCYTDIEPLLKRADTRYRWWTRYVPAGGGGLLVLFGLFFGVWRRREHNRQARLLESKLNSWDQKLSNASSRLTKLEQNHSFYFSAGTEDWEGKSADLSQECANAVNHAFLLYSKAEQLHQEARSLYEECGPLSVDPLEQGLQLLEDETIEFDTGTAEERRRIYLPLTEKYSGTAQQLLDDLETTYRRALDKIDEVEQTLEEVGDLTESAQHAVARADEAISKRRDLDLPVEHLVDEFQPSKENIDEAKSLQSTDPIRAIELFEEHFPVAQTVADRAEAGNSMVEDARGPYAVRGRKLRDRVADLRDRSYQVAEPDFDPDLRLDRTERDCRRVEKLVEEGKEKEAAKLYNTIEPNFDDIEDRLDVIEAAPEEIPATLDDLEADRDALKKRIPGAKNILETLREKHAADAFEEQSDNLEELDAVLDELEEWLAEIREHFDDAHYLAATADAETARELLTEGEELVDGIERIEEKLQQATDEARSLQPDVRAAFDSLADLASNNEPAIPNHLQKTIETIGEELDGAEAAMEEERPHWFQIRSRLEAVDKRVENLRPRAQQNVEDWQSAVELRDELEEKFANLRSSVEGESRARPHVDAKVDRSEGRFETWREQLEESDKGGSSLLRRGEKIKKAYRRAKNAWESELELIETYESEVDEVRDRLHEEDGRSLGYDVYVECDLARRSIDEAESAAENKQWDEALEHLDDARQEIDNAVDDAQDEYEEEKDRHTDYSSSSYSSSSSSFSSSSSSFSGGSSFSSSTSSAGSSFGGTSSGGSSFGGTSSGGSSW